jgi:hypothetical protein
MTRTNSKPILAQWIADHLTSILLGVLTVAALVLRIWGTSFGLPYRYHIDEVHYVDGAMRMANADFNLPFTAHGPNLFYVLLVCEYGAYFAVSLALGDVDSAIAFARFYHNDPTAFFLLARITSAVFGSLTILPTYLLGRGLSERRVGLVAAVFLASSFQHVRESHYGTPDVFAGFLVVWCLVFCLRVTKAGRLRDYILAGVFAGLATGTKFTNSLLVIPLGIAYLVGSFRLGTGNPIWRLFAGEGIGVLMGFITGFIVAYPNVILRPSVFRQYLQFLLDVGSRGFVTQFRIDAAPAWLYYLQTLTWGMGWALVALVILGLAFVLLRHMLEGWIVLCFFAVYYIFLARAAYYASRYLVPVLPVLCTFASLGLCALMVLARLHRQKLAVLACGVGAVFAIAQPIAFAVRHDVLLTRTDTRTVAKEWIESNIPPGTKIAVDWPVHSPSLRTMGDVFPLADPQYDVIIVHGIGLPEHSLTYYRDAGVRYIVLSSYIDDLLPAKAADVEARERFHQELERQCQLVHVITPYPQQEEEKPPFLWDQIFGPVTSLFCFERPGPTLKIYRVER